MIFAVVVRLTVVLAVGAIILQAFAAIAPVSASSSSPTPTGLDDSDQTTRFMLGFHETPTYLYEGDQYLASSTIVHVFHRLRIAVVATEDPAGFEASTILDPNIRYVELDEPGSAQLAYTPNDPEFSDQWAPTRIHAEAGWDTTRGASDVRVCIVDTGVHLNHPDLEGVRYLGGKDFVLGGSNPMDTNGHGTAVTGIAAASINNVLGVAGIARTGYYVARWAAGASGFVSDIIASINWCTDPDENGDTSDRADIINLSLFAGGPSQSLETAVDSAWTAGSLLVAAAGNGPAHDPIPIEYPAAYPQVVAVTCTRINDLQCSLGASKGPEAEVAAPGQNIMTTVLGGGYDFTFEFGGTSAAAPHVSGVAALVMTTNPSLTNVQTRALLNDTAEDLYESPLEVGWDEKYGWGLVRADLAVGQAEASAPPRVAFLQGLALDLDWGFPISAVTVWVQGLEAFTNLNGEYAFPSNSLHTGTWIVEFSHFGYETEVRTITLQSGSNQLIVFMKTKSGGPPPFGPEPQP